MKSGSVEVKAARTKWSELQAVTNSLSRRLCEKLRRVHVMELVNVAYLLKIKYKHMSNLNHSLTRKRINNRVKNMFRSELC